MAIVYITTTRGAVLPEEQVTLIVANIQYVS